MRKKISLILVVLFLAVGAGAFADHPDGLGIGINLGFGVNGGVGPALSLKLPSLPVFWTASLGISSNWFGLNVAGDYYFIDRSLAPSIDLDWYLGVGGYFGFSVWNDGDPYDHDDDTEGVGIALGARLPIGLSWQPRSLNNFLELFLDVVPHLGLRVVPFYFPDWAVGFDFGARLWF